MSSFYDDASLVVIPSGYKTSKVYAEKPTDGSGDLAFTRTGDTATRVNSAGLIEKVRTNLALYSEDFTWGGWNKYQATITANSVLAPNGTTTADTITDSAVNDVHIAYQSISFPAGEFSVSCYAKANTLSHAFLQIYNGTNFYASGIFNLTNGTVSGAGSITSVGNGWYRLSFTAQITAGVGFAYVGTSNGSSVSYSGTGQSLYIWGYQAETGVATAYIPTTTAAVSVGPVANVPRLDYLGSTCPRLLLEPQRTNLALYSEQMDNASWIKLNGSVTANAAVSPDGYTNADSFVPNTTSGVHALRSNLFNQSATAAHSWFVKADGYSKIAVRESELVGNYASFNLATGTLISTNQTGSIVNYGNGWYRCTLVDTTTGANAQTSIVVLPDSYTTGDPLINWSGDGTKGVLAYGAQVELGAYSTSLIPTLAASATRGADAASKTGISSLIGQTEGTLFVEMSAQASPANNWFQITDGTANNWVFIGLDVNKYRGFIRLGSSTVFSDTSFTLTNGVPAKIALAYKSGDIAFYINGTQIAVSSATFTPSASITQVVFGDLLNAPNDAARYSQALLFKTRLTNAALAELTSL